MSKTIELPDEMSKLIRFALDDLKKAEASPNIVIDMDVWHEPTDGGKCAVCLAGAVMRRGLPDNVDYLDHVMEFRDVCGKFSALNSLRRGEVSDAVEILGLIDDASDEVLDLDRDITEYSRDRDQFYSDMERLAADLEAAGY